PVESEGNPPRQAHARDGALRDALGVEDRELARSAPAVVQIGDQPALSLGGPGARIRRDEDGLAGQPAVVVPALPFAALRVVSDEACAREGAVAGLRARRIAEA